MGPTDELCEDKVRIPARIVNLTLLEQEAILTNIDPRRTQRRRGKQRAAEHWLVAIAPITLVKPVLCMKSQGGPDGELAMIRLWRWISRAPLLGPPITLASHFVLIILIILKLFGGHGSFPLSGFLVRCGASRESMVVALHTGAVHVAFYSVFHRSALSLWGLDTLHGQVFVQFLILSH